MNEVRDTKSKQEDSRARKKKCALIVVVCIVAALFIYLGVNTLGGGKQSSESDDAIDANVQTLEELEQQPVPDVASLNSEEEQSVDEEESAAGTEEDTTAETEEDTAIDMTAEQQKIMSMEDPDKSTLLEWFDGCAIVGDSFVAGLSSAQFLNSSIVFGKVGISVYGSDDLIASMEAVYPQKVFLCFGLNDMSHYGEEVEKFLDNYRPRIQKIQTDLPSADIYLVAVLPVREDVVTGGYVEMGYVDLYNQRLEELAAEMSVGFIDPCFILEQDQSYYGSDGMHVSSNFYYKWLTYLADMTGLSS